jgi:maltoporin
VKTIVFAFLSAYLLCQNLYAGDFFRYGLYMRSGIGSNSKGADQTCFNNPGTPANEFRLGNECANYGELIFTAHPKRPDDSSAFYLFSQMRLAYSQNGHTNWEGANGDDPIAIRESFVEVGGMGGSPVSFWAGKRFYRENDLYLNDFYYFAETSSNGGGVGHIPIGTGFLHLAWLRETSKIETLDGTRALNLFDLRLKTLEITPSSRMNFWLGFAQLPKATSLDESKEFASHKGWSLGVLHDQSVSGGFNHFAVLYGVGLLREFNIYAPMDTELGTSEAQQLKDSRRLRVVEHMTREVTKDWAFHFGSSFEWRDQGVETEQETWWNIGARPVYYLSDHYQLAFEAGTSLVNKKGQDVRRLTRLTIAPQVSINRSIWGRPLVRAFYSRSFWSRSNRGHVGGDAYRGNTSGGNYGLQVEAWF